MKNLHKHRVMSGAKLHRQHCAEPDLTNSADVLSTLAAVEKHQKRHVWQQVQRMQVPSDRQAPDRSQICTGYWGLTIPQFRSGGMH